MNADPLLSVEHARKTFRGIVAIDDATFDVGEGSITGLIGPNGAGKTTTFNVITGYHDLTDGHVEFDGRSLDGLTPHEVARAGLIRTFQISRELTGMTVMANMLLGVQDHPGESAIRALTNTAAAREVEEDAREDAEEILRFLNLWEHRDEYAGNLSGGQRKLLELGRALMADPKLLMLDEPVAGVNSDETDRLLDYVLDLRDDRDITFLVVEHDMNVIMSICDRIVGMADGEVISRGTPEEIRNDERMVEAYLGSGVDA